MKAPWTVASQAEFASSFGRTNYRFKYFDLVLESGGDPIDVVFNYKDLAHLKVVHNTFDIFYSHISDDVQSCVVMQKLFGLSFPLTHIALQLDQNRLFFHDSFLNVLLTSEVVAEALPDHRVKVTTTYGIGAPKWLLPFVFPILKRLLTRNYHVLMEVTARCATGAADLRRWGLRLPKASYSFQETLDLRARNVIKPTRDVPAPQPASVAFASIPADSPGAVWQERSLRRADLPAVRMPSRSFRACARTEGACLDQKSLNGERRSLVLLAQSGRRYGPILRIPRCRPSRRSSSVRFIASSSWTTS